MEKTDFKFIEFVRSLTATQNNCNNIPDWDVIENLKMVVDEVLQRVRDFVNVPLYINSGYRSTALNVLVKGAKNSQHLTGNAVDFTSYSKEIDDTAFKFISERIDFDQVIRYDTFIHVSRMSSGNRHQIIDYRTKK